MANRDWLEEREHVLEEEYFWRQERALIARLREQRQLERQRRALGEQIGVADEAFLAELQTAGFTQDNLDLLHLVPLVEVAWAGGVVSARERELILAMATSRGLAPGSPACKQLGGWLDQRPAQRFFDTALEAIGAILEQEDPEARGADERNLITYCTKIAEATGEVLGLVRISHAERECLERIAHSLTDTQRRVGDGA